MRLITEPTVILASTTRLHGDSVTRYTKKTIEPFANDNDTVAEIGGRLCYQSFDSARPGGQKAYMEHILSLGHGSICEHSNVGFIIYGVSRSLTHELIRHRAGVGYSELSQRFFEPEGDDIGFVLPPLVIGDQEQENSMREAFEDVYARYKANVVIGTKRESERWMAENPGLHPTRSDLTLIRKRGRESARALLPNATETHIMVTANMRAWRHIVALRGSIHADLEIRRLAVDIALKLHAIAPNLMQDMTVELDADRRLSVFLKYPKV